MADQSVQSKNDALHNKVERAGDEVGYNAVTMDGAGGSKLFPAKYIPTDRTGDDRALLKKEVGALGLGQVMVTDEDLKWLQKKKSAKERYFFDQWFARLFDMNDINKLKHAQQLYPEFWKEREEELNRQAEVQKRLALIKMRGPQTMEDMILVYAIHTGKMELPDKPLWRLDEAGKNIDNAYKAGIFSPSRFVTSIGGVNPTQTGMGFLGSQLTNQGTSSYMNLGDMGLNTFPPQ